MCWDYTQAKFIDILLFDYLISTWQQFHLAASIHDVRCCLDFILCSCILIALSVYLPYLIDVLKYRVSCVPDCLSVVLLILLTVLFSIFLSIFFHTYSLIDVFQMHASTLIQCTVRDNGGLTSVSAWFPACLTLGLFDLVSAPLFFFFFLLIYVFLSRYYLLFSATFFSLFAHVSEQLPIVFHSIWHPKSLKSIYKDKFLLNTASKIRNQ